MIQRWRRSLTDWLDRHYLAALVVTTVAFLLQVLHLYWLFAAVIMAELTGESWFAFPEDLNFIYIVADYVEVPALISTTVLYLNTFRRERTLTSVLYVVLLNTQWLHIFWITDNFVVQSFSENTSAGGASYGVRSWNAWVAWVAILIDFLELPVIFEMLRQVYRERSEIMRRVRARISGSASGGIAGSPTVGVQAPDGTPAR
jgi:hypothetical protein